MAYTINNSRSNVITVVADGTLDDTTDLTLIGKNYPGYGEILNENFRVPGCTMHCFDLSDFVPALGWNVNDERCIRCLGKIGIVFGARNQNCKTRAVRI